MSWAIILCSLECGDHRQREHPAVISILNVQLLFPSDALVSTYYAKWCHNPERNNVSFAWKILTLINLKNQLATESNTYVRLPEKTEILLRDFTGGKATGGWNWQTTYSNCIGLLFRESQDIFLFYKTSRPILGPTQLSIQWVAGDLFPGWKRPGREADHSHPPSAQDEWN